MSETVIPTTCASHCGGSCLLRVHLRDGVLSHIETDIDCAPQLRACPRGRSQRQREWAPDRLLHPLRRTGRRGEGKFEPVSWPRAIEILASEIRRVRTSYGPDAITYLRMGGDVGNLHSADRLAEVLSAAGGYTEVWGNPSFGAGISAQWITYGTQYTSNTRDDLVNSRLIIMWGWNPAVTVTGVNTAYYLAKAREAGARIVAVDARYTDSAAMFAEQWVPIRPGTDVAMLIAMAHVMITDGLYSKDFIARYTTGFEAYKDHVLGVQDGVAKTPEWAESLTSVPAATIRQLARDYARTSPAALIAGISPGRTAYGEQYHRAAITLAAMTGNVGVHGGDAAGRSWESVKGGYPYRLSWLARINNPVDRKAPEPAEGSPPGYRASRVHYSEVPDFIEKGISGGYPADCRMLAIVNSGYVGSFPDLNRIVAALKSERLEFTWVVEQFMTATAKFADLILPASTFLERNDIANGVGLAFYGYVNKVTEPLGDTRSHLEMASLLARALGLPSDGFDEEARLRKMVADSEIPDYEAFRASGAYRIPLNEPHVGLKAQISDPAKFPFPTPSGKIEIYSQRWAALERPDLPALPTYIPAWEGPADGLIRKYPLQMISSHCKGRANGQFRNIPWLRELSPQVLTMNPVDAAPRGISSGDLAEVFNDRGRVQSRVLLSQRIMPGVVELPHGAWYEPDDRGIDRGGCPNVLTRGTHSPGWALPFNSCLVDVKKA